jgi:branched-chain amino acid transport system permease protein
MIGGILRAAVPFVAAIGAALVVQFIIVPRIGGYGSELLVECGIAVILAVSLTVVNGFTGQFSIGHAGFMSLGGYFAAAIVYYGSFRLWGSFDYYPGWRGECLFATACIAGGILAAACGWIVGLPSLRLRGDYLAIVTLGFAEILRVLIQGTQDQLDTTSTDPALSDLSFPQQLTHLGGALGFSGQPVYTTPFCVWLAAALTLALTIRLKYSSYGRALLSIREDDIAAQAVGVNTTRLKVRAFMYAAFFAGIGGGLYAMKIGSTINASDFGFQKSFDYVIMVVLGGLGSISGAAIAAITLTLLPELLRAFEMYRMVIYSLLLIIIMIVRPQGLLGIREIWDFLPRRRKRP